MSSGKTAQSPIGWIDRKVRAAVLRELQGITGGQLTMIDPCGVVTLGECDQPGDLQISLQVRSLDFYRRVAWDGANGAAEAYLDGLWDCDNVTGLIQLFARNTALAAGLGKSWIHGWSDWMRRIWRQNTVAQSRKNIAAHYDLSNEFFRLFLDPTMAYSAGIFDDDSDGTMESASRTKFARVCRKLDLQPSDHLLEIGSGWGGLAIFAAREFGCRVTTTTISQEQYQYTKQAVREAGLEQQVTVLAEDYRKLTGRYEKIVSIEMIEAVGHEYYESFFEQCGKLLQEDGLMLLQAILIPEQRYERYRRSQDFIQRHIFPGGCLPSLNALSAAAAATTDLRVLEYDDFADHYARTLELWRHEFSKKLDDVRSLGMDDRFIRAWHYYFCYCEGGFRERQLSLTQLLFSGPQWRGNMARRPANERLAAPHIDSRPSRLQGASV